MFVGSVPFEMFINFLAQLWDVAGLPLIIGTLTAKLTQDMKFSPLIPFIEEGKPWIIRGVVTFLALVFQLAWVGLSCLGIVILGWIGLKHGLICQEMSVEIVQGWVMNYFAATVAYTHYFKTKAE